MQIRPKTRGPTIESITTEVSSRANACVEQWLSAERLRREITAREALKATYGDCEKKLSHLEMRDMRRSATIGNAPASDDEGDLVETRQSILEQLEVLSSEAEYKAKEIEKMKLNGSGGEEVVKPLNSLIDESSNELVKNIPDLPSKLRVAFKLLVEVKLECFYKDKRMSKLEMSISDNENYITELQMQLKSLDARHEAEMTAQRKEAENMGVEQEKENRASKGLVDRNTTKLENELYQSKREVLLLRQALSQGEHRERRVRMPKSMLKEVASKEKVDEGINDYTSAMRVSWQKAQGNDQ